MPGPGRPGGDLAQADPGPDRGKPAAPGRGSRPLPATTRAEVLAAVPLFAGLAPPDLHTVAQLATERRVARGSLVVRRDDPGSSLLVLVSGRLRAITAAPDGREVTHALLVSGGILGEIALIDGQPRSLDVTATTDATLLELARAQFLPFLLDRPALMLRVMEMLCVRLRRATATLEDVALAPLPVRLARVLLNLAAEHGRTGTAGIHIRLRLSQADLSAHVAATRERVNKQLRQWVEAGWIATGGREITLIHPERLRALLP